MEAILCVVEVDLSPKPLSNLAWAATHFKRLMNVIVGMNLFNKQLPTILYIDTDHESHNSLV